MKHSIKTVSVLAFAALLSSCLPQEKLTGRVVDTAGPVPEAAVLGMVWIEEADNAKSAPDIKGLKSEDRDAAFDKDMKDRGLPVAYARAFSDKEGRFTLDNFHFSTETKKAVTAMKQPKITRVTMWAFQKGYRKQAVTMFPKSGKKELPDATLLLVKPASWKDLYVENTVNSLTENYMLKGYSKEFGATKAEKSWIFEYTRANEQQAYDTSNIKGDKKMEELCGRDFSDIIVSTAGIQRNPSHEKCGELLDRIGAIREVEELWLAHSNTKQDPLAAAREVVKEALNTLSAETPEPKAYETIILEGLKEAGNTQGEAAMRNGVSNQAWQDEAKLFYGKGDKPAAYKALGYALYGQLPIEIQQGVLTVQLSLATVPGIKDTAAGFYLLMTRPQTAQLPGGDDGNHKDKQGYKVEGATETADKGKLETNPVPMKGAIAQKRLKLADDEIDVEKVRAKYSIGEEIGSEKRRETFEGREAERSISKKVYGRPSVDYFIKVENHLVIPTCEDCEDYEVKEKLQLYSADGTMLLQKDFNNAAILRVNVIKNGVFLVDLEPRETEISRKQEIYNAKGELLYGSQNIMEGAYSIAVSPQADYLLFLEKAGAKVDIKKLDLQGNVKLTTKLDRKIWIDSISNNGCCFLAHDGRITDRHAPSGESYREQDLMYFRDDKLVWTKTLEAENFSRNDLSKSAKYVLIYYGDTANDPCKGKVFTNDKPCKKRTDRLKVIDAATQKIIYDGLDDEKMISEYVNETIKN